jgi:hypothetical protein
MRFPFTFPMLALALTLAGTPLAARAGDAPASTVRGVVIGDAVPDFTATDADGVAF